MNLKYEIGQTVEVEHTENIVSTLTKRERATINSITVGKDGVAKYLTSMGAFTETSLDAFRQPINIQPDTHPCTTQPIAPQEDKPKFCKGDRVISVRKDWTTGVKGTVLIVGASDLLVSFDKYVSPSFLRGEDKFCAYQSEYDIEPYIEPEQPKEPIVLYCVKEHKGVCKLIKGKIYEFVCGNSFPYEDSDIEDLKYKSFEDYSKRNPTLSACLIKTEKRPAKVGEWVLIVDATCIVNGKGYENGDLLKIVEVRGGRPYYEDVSGCFLYESEYLVLDNYRPEPEKEPEPIYWSGKVVCVENDGVSVLTVGKVYTFINGETRYDDGVGLPLWRSKIKSIDDLNGRSEFKFIPYLGEA